MDQGGRVASNKPIVDVKPIEGNAGIIPIVVTEPIEGYGQNERLRDRTPIARYFRLLFKNDYETEWSYSDDVIIDVIKRNPNDGSMSDEDYNGHILDAMREFEPQVLPDQTAQDQTNYNAARLEQIAEDSATTLAGDDGIRTILKSVNTANKTVYMGPIKIHLRLEEMINEGKLDYRTALPEPGTHEKHIPAGSNIPYDKYTKFVPNKDGVPSGKTFSVIDQMADKLRMKMFGEGQNKSGDDKSIGSISDKAADDATASLFRRHLKQGIMLLYRFEQMKNLTQLKIDYDRDDNGQVKETPKPIHIWNPERANKQSMACSVVTFNSMRPNLVDLNNDHFEGLKD